MEKKDILRYMHRATALKNSLVYDDFTKLLLPALLFSMVEYILQLSDNVIAGNLFGDRALAGITLCQPYIAFITFVSMLIIPGTAFFASLAIGKENRFRANMIYGQGLIMSVFAGVLITVLSLIFRSDILMMFRTTPEVYNYVSDYFTGLLFQPLLIFYPVIFAAVIGEGGKKWCTISAIVLAVSNIVLSLILGKCIGMMGLSLGTVFSLAIASAILLMQFTEKNNPLKFIFRINLKDTLNVVKAGFTEALIFNFSIVLLYSFFNWFLLMHFNSNTIIVFTIVVNIQSFFLAAYGGFSQTLQPMVSIYRGETNFAGILKTTRVATVISGIIMVLFIALIYIFSSKIPLMFGVVNPALCAASVRAIRIYAWSGLFLVWGLLLANYLMNAGYILFSSLISVMMLFVFTLPLTFIFCSRLNYGSAGAWFAISISVLMGFIASMFPLVKMAKKRNFVFPWMLSKKVLNNEASFDVEGTKKNVKMLMDMVENELIKRGIEEKKILKILLMLEETYMLNIDKTKKDKKYYVECTLMFKRKLLMYIRSNGIYSNATDVNAMPDSLRQYLSTMIVSSQKGSRFSMSVGDNRTIYEF